MPAAAPWLAAFNGNLIIVGIPPVVKGGTLNLLSQTCASHSRVSANHPGMRAQDQWHFYGQLECAW